MAQPSLELTRYDDFLRYSRAALTTRPRRLSYEVGGRVNSSSQRDAIHDGLYVIKENSSVPPLIWTPEGRIVMGIECPFGLSEMSGGNNRIDNTSTPPTHTHILSPSHNPHACTHSTPLLPLQHPPLMAFGLNGAIYQEQNQAQSAVNTNEIVYTRDTMNKTGV